MILLVWFIWTEKPGRPQSKGSQRIGHNSATEHAHGGFQYTPVIDKRHILLATFFCQCLHKKMDACLQNLTKKKKKFNKTTRKYIFKLHYEYNWYNSDFYSDYWEGC